VVDCQQLKSWLVSDVDRLGQRETQQPTSFGGQLSTRVIDKNATHEAGRHGKELCAIFPRRMPLIHKPQVQLVDECGGLQGMTDTLAAQGPSCDSPQLAVHDG
jgi:hypothetical protein